MIKIEKDLAQIPASLQVPPVKRTAKTTHRIRREIIHNEAYPKNSSKTDKRYKMADIKKALFDVYNGKCAFCEQKEEAMHVEHFRPKSIYYWLAFSWSNLLCACFYCNLYKSNQFEITGQQATFDPTEINEINSLSTTYDTEQPKIINPESEDAEPLLAFQEDGLITSNDARGSYTIKVCRIDRTYLNARRKKVWDKFINDIKSEALEEKTNEQIEQDVMVLVRQFIRDSKDNDLQFLAFRRYALKHFLSDLLNNTLNPTT